MATAETLTQVWRMLDVTYPAKPGEYRGPERAAVYAATLGHLPDDVLRAAVVDVIAHHEYPTLPVPGAITKAAAHIQTGMKLRQPALEAWGDVRQMAGGRFGIYKTPQITDFSNPVAGRAILALGWQAFCLSDADEAMSWRARFVELYDQFSQQELETAQTIPLVAGATLRQLETRPEMQALTARLSAPTQKG